LHLRNFRVALVNKWFTTPLRRKLPERRASARRPAASSFALSENDTARTAAPAGGLRAVAGIDALIALQGIEDTLERRRHAVKRGRVALDVLDELKLGLLGGDLSPAILTRLQAAAGYLRQASGDAALDVVLGEIELRVEVEIAKMGPR
jgi:hypothetical protein